jgi:hypothetical protein
VSFKDSSGMTGWEVAEARGSKEAVRRLRALTRRPFVGVLVELAGLVGAAEHNGKRAMVMRARLSCLSVPCARVSCLQSAQPSKNGVRGSRTVVDLTPKVKKVDPSR